MKNIREYNPWVFEQDQDYTLLVSNDWDSFASAALLQFLKGWKIGWFYDFKGIYKNPDANEKFVGVDVALEGNIMSFDNHVTRIYPSDYYNKKCVNLNLIKNISRQNYKQKYCGSTLLQLYSIYNVPLPSSEEGKMLLLSIDSTFKGFYNADFKSTATYYLKDVLECSELLEVINRHTEREFEEIKNKYNLKNGKLYVGDRKLKALEMRRQVLELLEIPIPNLNSNFELVKELRSAESYLSQDIYCEKQNRQLFSFALCYKNGVAYTYKN